MKRERGWPGRMKRERGRGKGEREGGEALLRLRCLVC